jgi:DNA-directed RNA polymerase subunit L
MEQIKVINYGTKGDEITVEFIDTELSVVNSLRRVALSNIPALVFRGFPHKENLINISKNTSKFNNEYLKHRVQQVPIYYSNEADFETFMNKYEIRLNMANETNNIMYVTTEHFNIYDKTTGNIVNNGALKSKQLFPPDIITGEYILLAVLSPKITEDDIVEELQMAISFSVGTAKEDSCWNMVTKCCFENKRDETRLTKFLKKDPEVVAAYYKNDAVSIDKYLKGTMTESELVDFKILEGQRFYVPNNYILKLETVGVYTCDTIIKKACAYVINRMIEFEKFIAQMTIEEYKINTGPDFALFKDKTNTSTVYNLYIPNDDYTIGKIVETYLYKMCRGEMFYVSFKKEHPHDKHCYILFSFIDNEITTENIMVNFKKVSSELIKTYQYISSNFTEKI